LHDWRKHTLPDHNENTTRTPRGQPENELCFCPSIIQFLTIAFSKSMKRTVIIYGLALAALVLAMKFLEYRLFIRDLSIEFYVGVVAVFFAGLGIWAGLKLTGKKVVLVGPEFVLNEAELQRLEISKREHEVLELMAQGLSNQQIADKLFVSLNTIKTHASNLFLKLQVGKRTQAIQKGRELRLIP
jgi:two-component system, NarL family, response regulator LiaR